MHHERQTWQGTGSAEGVILNRDIGEGLTEKALFGHRLEGVRAQACGDLGEIIPGAGSSPGPGQGCAWQRAAKRRRYRL